jgi:hypothetical protein
VIIARSSRGIDLRTTSPALFYPSHPRAARMAPAKIVLRRRNRCASLLSMDPVRSASQARRQPRIRPELQPLVRELAELPERERREVVAAAEQASKDLEPTLPWESWDAARGVVCLGGDAVEDCDRLYDGS